MKRWAAPLLLLALAMIAAALALRAPTPLPATAPPARFSAMRALADVQSIAPQPHPMGSAAQAGVQAYLLRRMASLGLSPEMRPFVSARGAGRNLLGVLPGRDRKAPALLLMAHADSVPAGPGAADDGAGVATVLETVRALSLRPRQRDVMVLFTDGEELGSLGAHAFFTGDPAQARVGMVINLEARGDRGRAVMFETQPNAAPLIAALRREHALTGASSLMPDLYRRLPNGTDLTEAMAHGHPGLNFAFFSGFDAYHSPLDTPSRLDPRTLQDIGDKVLKAAEVLAGAPTLPGRAPDQTYADILGGPELQYPAWAAWALLAVASGLAVCAFVLTRTRVVGVLGGALAFLGLLAAMGAALYGLGRLRINLAAHRLAPLLRHDVMVMAGVALLALGVALAWSALAGRRLRPESLAFGALKIVGVGAVVLQVLAPLDAFVLAWPFVLIALAMALDARGQRCAALVVLAAALGQALYWSRLYFDLVGQVTPVALAPFAGLAIALLLPVSPPANIRTAWTGLVAALLGIGLSILALRP